MANLESTLGNEANFFCDVTALEPGQLEELTEVSKQLFSTVRTSRELVDGYALEVPVSTAALLKAGKFISLERLCCPWHGSTLELEPAASSFWLKLTGPEGTKAVLGPALAEYIVGFMAPN